MRRQAASLPLSPKVLKHFALATVIITALLAMFASGEETQLQAAIKAREAKNQLVRAEAEKLGTRKVASALKVQRREEYGAGYERINEREAPVTNAGSASTWSAGGSVPRMIQPLRAPETGRSAPAMPFGPPKGVTAYKKAKKPVLTEAQREALLQASRARSGGAGRGD